MKLIIALAAILAASPALAGSFTSTELNGTTYTYGVDEAGHSWSGQSTDLLGTTYTRGQDGYGNSFTCRSTEINGTVYGNCN